MKALVYGMTCFFVLACSSTSRKDTSPNIHTIGSQALTLPDRMWAVYQDHEDIYWFGSNGDGLYRYDGQSLTRYTTSDGLIDNTVRGLQEDHNGLLYIETPAGVSRYDGCVFSTLPIATPEERVGWQLDPEDLWFGCNATLDHLYRYDGTKLHELALPTQDLMSKLGPVDPGVDRSPYLVSGINKDEKGHLWIGTFTAGAYRYDGAGFIWIGEPELSTLPDGRVPGVRCMIADKDGHMWLSNILHRYLVTSDTSYDILPGIDLSAHNVMIELPYFMSAVQDEQDHLWMVTYAEGLWRWDGTTLSQFMPTIDDEPVLLISVFIDDEGLLWLGTDTHGVCTFDGKDFTLFSP